MWCDLRIDHAWIVECVDDDGQWILVASFTTEKLAREYVKEQSAIFFDDVFRVRYR